MKAVSVRFPNSNIEGETLSAYKADWEIMIRDAGINRFSLGLQRACLATSFFPMPGDVKKHIPMPSVDHYKFKPSPEDLARKAAGERSYGQQETIALLQMWEIRRRKLGRPLTQQEENALIAELDEKISAKEIEVESAGQN